MAPFKVEPPPPRLEQLEGECRTLCDRLREHGQTPVADAISTALTEPEPARRVQRLQWWVWKAVLPEREPIYDLGRRLADEGRHPSYEPECIARPLLAGAAAVFDERRQRCLAQVTSWRWSRGDVFSLEPYYFERHSVKPGRWLKQAPEQPGKAQLRHGYDDAGRVCVIEEPGKSLELYEHHAGHVDAYLYQQRRSYEPVNARRHAFIDDRITRLDFAGVAGVSRALFEWDASILRRVHNENSSGGCGRRDWTEDFEYDDAGLTAVYHLPLEGVRSPIWERPRKGETLASLLAQIEPHIAPHVRETLGLAAERRPAFALALITEEEAPAWLLPGVALGLEPQPSADDDPWFLEEEQLDSAPISPELEALCRRANKLAADGGTRAIASMRKCLERAAIALRDSAETLPIERTQDFVVFISDVELSDPRPNIRKLARPELTKRLKLKGLL